MNINYCHLWKVLALVDHLCGKIVVPFSLARPPLQSLGSETRNIRLGCQQLCRSVSGAPHLFQPRKAKVTERESQNACSLSSSISLKLVLSLTLSLFFCRFLTISLCNYRFPWLAEMGSTGYASTLLLATQPYLPRLACQTLSVESRQRDWYYLS